MNSRIHGIMDHIGMQDGHFRPVRLVVRVQVEDHGLTHVYLALLLLLVSSFQLGRRKTELIDGTWGCLTGMHRRVYRQMLALLFCLSRRIVGKAFAEPAQALSFLRRLCVIPCETVKVVTVEEAVVAVAVLWYRKTSA